MKGQLQLKTQCDFIVSVVFLFLHQLLFRMCLASLHFNILINELSCYLILLLSMLTLILLSHHG